MGVAPTGRRVRRHVRGTVRKEVLAEARRLEGERTSVAVPDGGKVAVSAWLTSWIAARTTSVRPKTLVGYHTDQRHIDAAIGGVLLGRLTPEHVEKMYADMADQGLAVGSVLHVRRTLSAALSLCDPSCSDLGFSWYSRVIEAGPPACETRHTWRFS